MKNWSYKSLFIIIFFLLIGIVLLSRFVFPKQKISAAWFNDGWKYRKAIPVTNTLGSTVTNQRLKITIDTAALITTGKLQSNCNDLRITDINGQILDHWDTGCNTTTTNIYIKLQSLPATGSTIFLYYGNSSASSIEKPLGTSENPGTSCQMMKDQGSVITNGLSYIVPGGADIDKQLVYCDQTTDGGGWALVMNQKSDTGGFFTNSTEAQNYNESNPTADRYSILGKLAKFKDNGIFIFKINWPGNINRNIWSQTSNPISEAIAGYTAITVDQTANSWAGIALSSDSPSTFIDGSPGVSGWYYAVASYVIWTGGIPSYSPMSLQTQLWVKGNNTMNNVSVGTPLAEEISPAPIAYWKFDEGISTTVYDSSSNKNNGIFGVGNSAPTWASEDQCISGKCLQFNGTNNYLSYTNTLLPDVGANANLTISAWIKPFSATGTIFSKGQSSNCFNYGISITGGTLRARNSNNDFALGGTITTNIWQHLVIVYTNSGAQGYINGKSVGSNASGATTSCAFNQWVIGIRAFNALTSENFNGLIDEVKIYPYARTAAQIKSDYASGLAHTSSSKGTSANLGSSNKNGDFLSNGLVGYWKMDENIGTTTLDSSGNNNTGTFAGTTIPTWTNGKFGIGTSYNGTDSNINMGKKDILYNQSAATWAAWIKPSALPAQWSSIITSWEEPTSHTWVFDTYGNGLALHLKTQGDVDYPPSYTNGSLGLVTGSWQHVVATYDGNASSNQIKFYINGVLVWQTNKTNAGTLIANGAADNLKIGVDRTGTSPFAGSMDEVRVYNRALSPSEVSMLYNWAPSPVGYWDFNDGSGNIVQDKSGLGNTGVWNGTLGSQWSAGKYGSAGNFNGSDNRVVINNANFIHRTNNFTYSWWTKRTNFSHVGSYFSNGTWPNALLVRQEDASNIDVYSMNALLGSWTFTPTIGTWYHLAIVRDGNFLNLYVNGIKTGNPIAFNVDVNPSANLWIGDSQHALTESINGSIDDVKIYNYARTQKQITEDMNGGHPVGGSPVGSQIAYFRFDEGFGTVINNAGSQGANLNANFGAGASVPTWTNDGKYNKALNFATPNSYATISNSSIFNGSSGFTASVWAKSNNTAQDQTILSANGPFFLRISGGKFRVGIYNGIAWTFVNGSTNLTNNTWYHLTLTYDGTNMKSYINGILDSSTPKTGNIAGFATIYIGYPIPGGENFSFNGLIDEVKIYNSALNQDEIKIDYNRGASLQMGSLSSGTGNTAPSTASSQEYCVPGDTVNCASPIAEWKFDEGIGATTYDTSGNNNFGTFGVGNAAPIWTQGKIGKALSFNSSKSQFISTPGITLSNSFTIETWVYPLDTSDYKTIVSKGSGATTNYCLDTRNSDNSIGFFVYDSGGVAHGLTGATTLKLSLNKWSHITGVYNAAATPNFQIYLNGVAGDSANWTGTIATNASNTTIGSRDVSSNYFTGKIDQTRIFNYARTPAQIAWDYNRGGPIGWWKLDECQGNTAYDWSGIGNTGTISIGAAGSQTSPGTCTDNLATSAWNNGKSGKYNSSLNFDGTDDYISRNSSINTGNNFSVFAWVKPQPAISGRNVVISNGYPFTTDQGWLLSFQSNNAFFISIGNDNAYAQSANGVINNGSWNFIGATVTNGGASFNLYLNGKLISNASSVLSARTISYIDNTFFIGKRTTEYFNGQIDDTKIFNYVLTPDQIKTLYNNGAVSFSN